MSDNENQNDHRNDELRPAGLDAFSYDTGAPVDATAGPDAWPTAYDEPMTGPLDAPARATGLHPVNVGQLVMGVAFAGMVVVWALLQGDVVETHQLRWLMPMPWLVAGAAGLAATVWPTGRGPARSQP
ncbi:hypothetical protein [Nocardioides sp. zg-1228]|uniref:hypothetical protein n=1 Tax=Nocardioides sp. zg-1228 TaxID=2763008 RepID=UPI0016429727|nr:hypothetical protein [Nocardioides sp. zg-1228]MBC2933698.1 hypothetical protein [Nocardioides sp. zg-1228]QSF58481.1 hypothetical protein JX575_04570 [Nocardioides sp. zg-1228]